MIEADTARLIGGAYKFSSYKLGFQAGTGAETVKVGHIYNRKTMRLVEVFDLIGTHDAVPRDLLYNIVQKQLLENLTNMVCLALQPSQIQTQGDDSRTIENCERRVPQGSSLSPTFFNMYIDTLPERIESRVERTDDNGAGRRLWKMTLFADVVKIQASSSDNLQ